MSNPVNKSSLLRVLGLYGAGCWIVLQVIDVLAQNAGLPSWVFSLALVLLILGLPIVMATAYVQGLARASASDPEAPTATPDALFTWRNAVIGGVSALALWGLVVTGWLVMGPTSGPALDQPPQTAEAPVDLRSVAVLPFATRAAESDGEAAIFSEGMHDDLLTQLAKIDSLTVISRTSVMQYAGTVKPIPEIASELGVATVLEGGVQRAGDRVRVNVQLIEASTDRHLWAETYDEELTAANIFAIQSDLSTKIAEALKATLTPETEARIAARPTESLEAFDLNSRARHILNGPRSRSRDGLEEAQRLAEAAIEADAGFAQAWTTLAMVFLSQYGLSFADTEGALAATEAAVDRALSIDPDLSGAHTTRGSLLTARLDYEGAEAEFQTAIELNPGSEITYERYSNLLIQLARIDEAAMASRRAVELNPLSLNARASYADVLFWQRDWPGTIRESEKVIEAEPNNDYAYYNIGYGRAMLGQHDAAIEAFQTALALNDDPTTRAGLAWAWAKAGQQDSALVAIAAVPEQGSLLKEIAIVHATLGDLDTAFEFLDRAAEDDPGSIGQLRTDPTGDPLRADPRYEQLLRRVGL